MRDRERIFERFYRAESARSPGAGSGLGLSIARGLAERNGGRLDLLETDSGAVLRLLLRQPATSDGQSRSDDGGEPGRERA